MVVVWRETRESELKTGWADLNQLDKAMYCVSECGVQFCDRHEYSRRGYDLHLIANIFHNYSLRSNIAPMSGRAAERGVGGG